MTLIDEIKVRIAPYIRSAIIGESNRLAHGAYYGGKIGGKDNTYKLNGKQTTIENQQEQDFFKVMAFVEKYLRKEIGESNKKTQDIDSLISEILHVIAVKQNSTQGLNSGLVADIIMSDPDFNEVSNAFQNSVNGKNLASSLDRNSLEGFGDVVRNGEYGEMVNGAEVMSNEINSSQFKGSESDKNQISNQINNNFERAIGIQNQIIAEAESFLSQNAEAVNLTKKKIAELTSKLNACEKNSPEYNSIMNELRQTYAENSDIIENDRKLKKAKKEISRLNKLKENSLTKQTQMGE